MKVSYQWLQTHFDTQLPDPQKIEDVLTFHTFEIDGVEEINGDTIFDVDVLPNRAHDCLSHRGIAKELSVLLEIPLKRDIFRSEIGELPRSKELTASIEDPLLCRRYTGALMKGVTVGPSPDWLKEKLEAIGQKSINNIVDATNYIMFELGQPLHAFDVGQMEKDDGKYAIAVRDAEKKYASITALDGENYKLSSEDLLIVDGVSGSALGIAGIKGGEHAEVNEKTKDIIIESANFDPIRVRKTSQDLKLRTDASTRFENGLSPEIALYGLTEVVRLIIDIAGGEVEGYVDEYPKRAKMQYKVGVSVGEINQLLGTSMAEKDVEGVLGRYGFVYEKVRPIDIVRSLAPTYKGVPYVAVGEIQYDNGERFSCSSFINHLFVQGGISLPSISIDQYVYGKPVGENEIEPGDVVFFNSKRGKVRYESVEYFKGTKVNEGIDHCALYIGDGKIIHAAQGEGMVIEESLEDSKNSAGLIIGYRRMTDNTERYVVSIPFERLDLRIKEDLIEEVARVYGYENITEEVPQKEGAVPIHKKFYYAEKIRDILTKKGFSEVYTYSLRDKGELEIENPLASDKNFVRSTLLEGINDAIHLNEKNKAVLGLDGVRIFEIGDVFVDGEEKTMVCVGSSEEKEGVMSTINELLTELACDQMKGEGLVHEFSLDDLLKTLPDPEDYDVSSQKKEFSYQPFSIYPAALRDVAVWVPEETSSEEVRDQIRSEAGDLLIQINLFDEYTKEGRVSYAFKLAFQSNEKTLSDEEVGAIMEKITSFLNSQKGFEVR